MGSEEIVRRFFAAYPEHWGSVKRATFAYHLSHSAPNAHYFNGSWREDECRWCGRSRALVRWGDEPPECPARPKWADDSVESVIVREEALFAKVLDRARKLAGQIDIATLTGEELARVHHTYGVDPSMLEAALLDLGRPSFPERLHEEYQRAYARHRDTGKRGLVREVIVAKTAQGKGGE